MWRPAVAVVLCAVAALAEAGQDGTAKAARRVLTPRRVTERIPLVDGHDLQFRRLNAEGLSRTRVAQIVQDARGFMWFGTQRGLYRYDGHELRVFRHEARRRATLQGVYIHSLLRDRADTLWVGSDGFVDRFDPRSETVTPQAVTPDGSRPGGINVLCMLEDASGAVWLCTRGGLYRVDPTTRRSTVLRHRADDPTSLASDAIQAMGEDRRGALWVGTSEGLDRLDRSTLTVASHLPLANPPMGMAFHEDRFGVFWIIHGAAGELAVFDRDTDELQTVTPASSAADADPVVFLAMLEDRDGAMWFGTLNHGILKFDRDRRRFVRYTSHPTEPGGLSDRRVNVLYQDHEGLIWAGLHQSEPNYFLPRPPPFQSIQVTGRQSTLASAVLEAADGRVWLGLDRGLSVLDRKTWTQRTVPALGGEETTSMVEGPPGVLWIGTAGRGLRRFDQRTGQVRSFRHEAGHAGTLPSDFVEQVKRDRRGAIWAVTWRGLARWDSSTEQFVTYMPAGAPPELTLHTATFARNGIVWIGSNLGMHRLDPVSRREQWFRHDQADDTSLSNDRVNSIHEAADGSLWIATPNGLDHRSPDGGPLRRYAQEDGLPGNAVSCILEDDARQLWMSTDRGIGRLDVRSGRFQAYGTADGLPGVNMTGWDSCARAESGEMFFAGFAGAAAFFPHRIVDRDYVPPAAVTRMRLLDSTFDVDGRPVSAIPVGDTAVIRLRPAQGKFAIEFAALSFLSPETNRLRYRLHGLQDEWSEVTGDQRVATYMALPPGAYTFEVQSATSQGPWSSAPATLRIVMLPPWWTTWSFYALASVVLAAVLYVSYRLRVQQLTRAYNVRLEERWAERTRIARELHDTLLQSFQGLMFRLQAVRDLLPDQPARSVPVLETALLQGERAIDEARTAVTGLRSAERAEPDVHAGLAALAATAAQLAHGTTTPSWDLVTKGHVKEIPGTVLCELYPVVQEAIVNAFKHAQASVVTVEVRYGVDTLSIAVSDDGVGFDAAALPSPRSRRHWGVQGMTERIEGLGGTMALRTRPGEGTRLLLSLPATVAYRDPSLFSRVAASVWWPGRRGARSHG